MEYSASGDWLVDTMIGLKDYLGLVDVLLRQEEDGGSLSSKTVILIIVIPCSVILGIPCLFIFLHWASQKFIPCWKRLAAGGNSRWEQVRPHWPRKNAELELDPAVEWPTTAADYQRRMHWREKVMKNLARKSQPTEMPYPGFVEPPQPAITTNEQRFNGYNV